MSTQTRQAVMVIEAPPDMGKTWLVSKMRQYCQQSAADVPAAQVDFRNPREIHEIQDALGMVRLLRDKLGHDAYFAHLNAIISAFTEPDLGMDTSGLAGLRQNIESYFNLDEVQGLCFDLGVNYENLAGATLFAKSRSLVTYCLHRSMIGRLIDACLALRPEVDWRQGLDDYLDGAGDGETAVPTQTDSHAPLHADSDRERQNAERQINNAFFDCLAALLADKQPVALLFDAYEAAPPEAQRWLRDELLPRLNDDPLKDIVAIITGRKTPDLTDLGIKTLLVETKLDPFVEADVREYFEERRNITGLDLRTIILTSGGVPGALAMMADHAMPAAADDDDFFSDL
ncbi:MAG: hypothetical protein GY803_21325 [Chloroflexi bacterium]|nr:hypothetical protein [Chloroflexota bacterium]